MKRLAIFLLSAMFAARFLCCAAQAACAPAAVRAAVEAPPGPFTLGDLLTRDSCPQLRAAGSRVGLGAAPRPGSVRVLEGSRVRTQIEELANENTNLEPRSRLQVPERIVVRPAGETKSCAEIASFLANAESADRAEAIPEVSGTTLNCAAARGVRKSAPLALIKTSANVAMRRREFWLRCIQPEDCVPFLVWAHEDSKAAAFRGRSEAARREPGANRFRSAASGNDSLVKAGQTATLTWDQAGLRIVLPVTCLETGTMGQFVRVRFKNAQHILRAEVVGKARLRASM